MTQTRTHEELLVLKTQDGSEEAFTLLYELYQPSLLRFAYKIVSDRALAQDAVQDAWILLSRTLKKLHNVSMFRARAFQAVRWRALDLLRKRGIVADDESKAEAAETTLEDKWVTSDQLKTLLSSLPKAEAHTLYLFYLEELGIAEIALVLEVPAGTVKSRLNRARSRLRQRITGEEND